MGVRVLFYIDLKNNKWLEKSSDIKKSSIPVNFIFYGYFLSFFTQVQQYPINIYLVLSEILRKTNTFLHTSSCLNADHFKGSFSFILA